MKRKANMWHTVMVVSLATGLLSACTPDGTVTNHANEQKETPVQQERASNGGTTAPVVKKPEAQEQTSQPAVPAAAEASKTTGGKIKEGTVDGKTLPKHKSVEVTLEGMKEKKNGTLFKSEQGYYLYVLPGYKAAGEEPGKDVILVDRDERHFMRVEKLPANADLNAVIENGREELKLTGEVYEQKDVADPFFKKAKAYLFASDGKVTRAIIVQEIKGQKFRFTLTIANSESSEGVIPCFWAMIKTIGVLKG